LNLDDIKTPNQAELDKMNGRRKKKETFYDGNMRANQSTHSFVLVTWIFFFKYVPLKELSDEKTAGGWIYTGHSVNIQSVS
jgi:hypothetical protein